MGGKLTKDEWDLKRTTIIKERVPTEKLLTELRKATEDYDEKTITVINDKGG